MPGSVNEDEVKISSDSLLDLSSLVSFSPWILYNSYNSYNIIVHFGSPTSCYITIYRSM